MTIQEIQRELEIDVYKAYKIHAIMPRIVNIVASLNEINNIIKGKGLVNIIDQAQAQDSNIKGIGILRDPDQKTIVYDSAQGKMIIESINHYTDAGYEIARLPNVNNVFYTLDQLKEQLPDVKIVYGSKTYLGRLRGRQMEYASVYVPTLKLTAEFTWETVLNSVNSGSPLKI